MINKAVLKKVNEVVGWIIFVSMLTVAMYYFFVSKEFFKETLLIIVWSLCGILHGTYLIDARYFSDDFSVKKNLKSIIVIAVSVFFIISEANGLWF